MPGACDAKVWRWSYTSCNNALTCSAHTKYVIFSRLKIFRETLLFEGFFLLKSNKVIDSQQKIDVVVLNLISPIRNSEFGFRT